MDGKIGWLMDGKIGKWIIDDIDGWLITWTFWIISMQKDVTGKWVAAFGPKTGAATAKVMF